MLDFIGDVPNPHADEFNPEIIVGAQDKPFAEYAIIAMKELEAVENIKIEKIKYIQDQDEIDLNNHAVNINFKKKDMSTIEIPKHKRIVESRVEELVFTIRVSTNLNEKVIEKRILLPDRIDGFLLSNGKKMKDIWQILDASTYSQRGKITLKSRMPIIIYHNKRRMVDDVTGVTFTMPSYSYALETMMKKAGSRKKVKFINPLLFYCNKMGYKMTRNFFGMDDIVFLSEAYDEKELKDHYIFPVDQVFCKVKKHYYDSYEMVRSYVCMVCNLRSRDFPLDYSKLEDREYWLCRIGYIGSVKSSDIRSFHEKGMTTVYMAERLMDEITRQHLRLPDYYKQNIYYLMYWMITNFDSLKDRRNISMENKRIRRNECIVNASLGRKINENLNKLIEKKSKSKMNTMDTLLELFNFNSDIIISGMRNLNDVVKGDDLVNDLTWLLDISFTAKGPQSLGESSSKMIAAKYRYLDPSMVGIQDLSTSSNSDRLMSA